MGVSSVRELLFAAQFLKLFLEARGLFYSAWKYPRLFRSAGGICGRGRQGLVNKPAK